MRGRRSSGYGTGRFSADAVLSLVFGILGWLLFLLTLVQSIVTGGAASVLFGYLFLAAIVFGIWGAIFSVFAWNAEEGTLGMKRFLVLFNFILVLVGLLLIVSSFF